MIGSQISKTLVVSILMSVIILLIKGVVKLFYCRSSEQLANSLTEPLDKVKFLNCKRNIAIPPGVLLGELSSSDSATVNPKPG